MKPSPPNSTPIAAGTAGASAPGLPPDTDTTPEEEDGAGVDVAIAAAAAEFVFGCW